MTQNTSQNPVLASSLGSIRHQAKLMREHLAEGRLMPALKNCSNFLSEMRSSAFSPKEYYELYMEVFDALEGFSAYLLSSYKSKQAKDKDAPFLTDLYELVQYTGNIVPRLYLMIVIGTTCMAVKNTATKDIMKDMMEMCRGVQHPIRGLFLRHYLCQRSKDLFPLASLADFDDTVDFLVANFVEMNKLWVRLQHQGHSSERSLRYQERKELKILVGSNLVRLSQVVDDFSAESYSAVEYYKTRLFPTITEQIIQCKDHLAQSYLIDVVIQIFPDEFHFATLDELLGVFSKLHPMLKKSDLVASLVDRFVTYQKFEDLAVKTEKLEGASEKIEAAETVQKGEETEKPEKSQEPKKSEEIGQFSVDSVFAPFWQFYTNLRSAEPPLSSDELVPILQSLVKLLLAFDGTNVSNLDKIYKFAAEDLQGSESADSPADSDEMQRLWRELLMTPVEHYADVKRLLELPFFYELYARIGPGLQKRLACEIAEKLLAKDSSLHSTADIDTVFKYLSVLIEDPGTQLNTAKDLGVEKSIKVAGGEKLVSEGFLHIQETVCKVLHLVRHNEEFKAVSNLFYVRKKYLSKAPQNAVYTYPTLVTKMSNLLRIAGYRHLSQKKKHGADQRELMLSSNFKNVSVIIDEIYQNNSQFHAELVLNLYLNLATVADQLRQENIAYELFSQCFVVYEENLVLVASQGQAINPHDSTGGSLSYQSVVLIANRLASSRYFSKESYDALITKITLYGSKLLKKQDQCRAIYQCAHLWWWCDLLIEGPSPTVEGENSAESVDSEKESEKQAERASETESGKESERDSESVDSPTDSASKHTADTLYHDARRVLECLQKSLRVADSCMDPYLSLKLFVEILNRCLIFNIYDNWMVDARYISGLIELIRTNFANFEDHHLSGADDDQEARLLRQIEAFFNRTLDYLVAQQQATDRLREIVV